MRENAEHNYSEYGRFLRSDNKESLLLTWIIFHTFL